MKDKTKLKVWYTPVNNSDNLLKITAVIGLISAVLSQLQIIIYTMFLNRYVPISTGRTIYNIIAIGYFLFLIKKEYSSISHPFTLEFDDEKIKTNIGILEYEIEDYKYAHFDTVYYKFKKYRRIIIYGNVRVVNVNGVPFDEFFEDMDTSGVEKLKQCTIIYDDNSIMEYNLKKFLISNIRKNDDDEL